MSTRDKKNATQNGLNEKGVLLAYLLKKTMDTRILELLAPED